MGTLPGTTRTLASMAIGCWAILLAGCNAALRAEMASSRSLDAAAAAISPALSDYHRELVNLLGTEEARTVNDFVERMRLDVTDRGLGDAHAIRFISDLGRIRRDRVAEEDRYRTAMGEVGAMRRSATRLYRSAEIGSGLQGTLHQYLDLLLDSVAPVPTATFASEPR